MGMMRNCNWLARLIDMRPCVFLACITGLNYSSANTPHVICSRASERRQFSPNNSIYLSCSYFYHKFPERLALRSNVIFFARLIFNFESFCQCVRSNAVIYRPLSFLAPLFEISAYIPIVHGSYGRCLLHIGFCGLVFVKSGLFVRTLNP